MVTEEELEELISDHPTLYHMAERGSWPAVRTRGLLSTSALLDLYEISEPQRTQIERRHRPASVPLTSMGLPRAVIRDQIPMSDSGLRRCLPPHLTPERWYEILNAKVFFWLSKERLLRLTGANAYRDREHDVLEVDSRSLFETHRNRIRLCPINSGCTKPYPHFRDESSFARIEDYPYSEWRRKRRRYERVVEVAVDHSVPDIREHVQRVVVIRDQNTVSLLEG